MVSFGAAIMKLLKEIQFLSLGFFLLAVSRSSRVQSSQFVV